MRKKKFQFFIDGVTHKFHYKAPHPRDKADGIIIKQDVEIFVNPKLRPVKKMEVVIHELTHAYFWDKKEKEVDKFARTVAKLLYESGWRLEKAKKKGGRKPQ